jgi:molybdopterin-binding protein
MFYLIDMNRKKVITTMMTLKDIENFALEATNETSVIAALKSLNAIVATDVLKEA